MAEYWIPRVFDESIEDITTWITSGLQESADKLTEEDLHELALEIQTRHQNRIDPAKKKLDKVHQLMVAPDFRASGGLVKVSSLKEALE